MITNDKYAFSLSLELTLAPGRVVEFDDVISFTSTFAINTIPSARVAVPGGRDAVTDEPAPIHALLKELTEQVPANVWLIQSTANTAPQRFLIFEGILTGVGWAQTSRSAQYILSLTHWLQHLNNSSAISSTTSSVSAYNLSMKASTPLDGNGNPDAAAEQVRTNGWTGAVNVDLINEETLDDIWGKTLYEWLKDLASKDPIDSAIKTSSILGITANATGRSNLQAALARMKPGGDQPVLAIDVDNVERPALAQGIREALKQTASNGFEHTTIWGKLVGEVMPDYALELIPRTGDALVVPSTGGLRSTFITITANDYSQANLNSGINQPLQAVAIAAPTASQTGGILAGGARIDISGCTGLYKPTPTTEGIVIVKLPPPWFQHTYSKLMVGAQTGDGTVNTPMDPPAPGRDPAQDKARAGEELAEKLNSRAYLLAKQLYVSEVMRERSGSLVGRLRFDIAPGSSVLVMPPSNINDTESVQPMYAKVVSVSQFIDASEPLAATSFTFSHTRGEDENKLEGRAVDRSPLYNAAKADDPATNWVGANMGVRDATTRAEIIARL